jgi:hypothetical protein
MLTSNQAVLRTATPTLLAEYVTGAGRQFYILASASISFTRGLSIMLITNLALIDLTHFGSHFFWILYFL